MKVKHILDGAPLYTNCFLLTGNKGHAVAIDPAADVQEFVRALEEEGAVLTHILLTHGHYDHVASVDALREKFGAKMHMHKADAEQFGLKPDEVYTDFGKIVVDDMVFTTIFTPGHTPGSTCISCDEYLFAGDTLFAGGIGRTDFPGGDPKEMMRSLKKLCEAITEDMQVFPGHEEFSTMDVEKRANPYLKNLA